MIRPILACDNSFETSNIFKSVDGMLISRSILKAEILWSVSHYLRIQYCLE